MMERVEERLRVVKLNGSLKIQYGDYVIGPPPEACNDEELPKEHAKIDVDEYSDELFDLRTTYNIDVEGDLTRGLMIQQLFEELVEDKLIQPTFVTEHPRDDSARETFKNDGGSRRTFEFIVGGVFECVF